MEDLQKAYADWWYASCRFMIAWHLAILEMVPLPPTRAQCAISEVRVDGLCHIITARF